MEGLSRSISRSVSRSNWGMEEVFMRSSRRSRSGDDDEEALKWAALEKLPTYDRLRTGIMKSFLDENQENNQGFVHKEVDVRKLDVNDRQAFIERIFKVAEEDNEKFLRKFRNRVDKVGIKLPTVEVRFQHLRVEADSYIGTRALPTLLNTARNLAESALGLVGIKLSKTTKLTILKDASGIIKPSRMALLLGPPSSGKTTLLLALAGKLDPTLEVKGDVTYNGYKLNEFVPVKTSAYISQNDVHIGELTVKETLDFSARFQGVGSRYELLAELARREKAAGIFPEAEVDLFMKATAMEGMESSLITDYTLKILGLDICRDTVVGDEMRRGISGGQRKRVTTGEMIVGPTKTLFMDEISTGLDSSTTFQIVKCLQQIVHLTEATVFMSLLQPAPETFDLFDDIFLLSEGQIIYQGPREHVVEFFESCGFRCPERKGTADFLQEVTSKKDQEQYWADKSKPYRYISVTEFANRFKRFHVGMRLENELSVPFNKSLSHQAALVFNKYAVPTMELLKTNWDKEILLIKRNSFVYVFKTVQIIIVALIVSTVFLRTKMHERNVGDGSTYIGALLFAMIMNMFNGFAELALTIARLPVFYKHRDMLFYPTWTFTLPNFLLRLPISLVEALVWVVVTYYTIGFAPEASRFFKQLLIIFLIQQMACGLFRVTAALCRTMIIANTGGSLMLLIVFMLGGFILPKREIPNWWIWGYWISPLTYGFNAIATNEMLAPRWMRRTLPDGRKLGIAVLDSFDVPAKSNWFWIGVGALIGYIILFNVLFTFALMYLSPLGKKQAILSEEDAEEMEDKHDELKDEPRLQVSKSLSSADGNNTREMEIRRMGSRTNPSGISRNGADSALESAAGVAPRRGMVLPFTPLAMSFDDVNYFVDMPAEMKAQGVTEDRLQLLREVTGTFRPGVLTALMGVSGAGKTTLMDVLAGRKTGGYIEGDIRISGFPKVQETFARISGYCEQNDIHSPQVTVKESLIYSAFLRLPKEVGKLEKLKFVDEVMDLVELDNLKDAIVGLPGITGLSTEQRKRLTIAVELVANPSIIFMDEPTSGLDARAAAIVMRTVRNTVDTGRTVVCTIHQPSIDIFEAFDELLLMKRGGQVIYSGPLGRHSHKVIEYFEAIPGTPKIKDKYNPATWMLEVSSISAEIRLGIDFAEYYKSSSLHQRNKMLVKELSTPPPGAKDLYFPTQYSQSSWGQFKSCVWKQWITYWRSPDYNLVRYFFTLAAALMLGTIFWRVGTKRESSSDLTIIIGAMYAAVLFVGINNCSTVQPIVAVERTVFYREKAAGMYSALPYAIAQVITEIPYVFIQTTYYTLIVYAMVSFQWTVEKFFWFFFISFFSFLYFTYYGMMTVSITPNHQVASIFAAAFYSLFNLFNKAEPLDMWVYLSERPKFNDFGNEDALAWHETNIPYAVWGPGATRARSLTYVPSQAVKHNGTLYAHVFFARSGYPADPSDPEYQPLAAFSRTHPLVAYLPKSKVDKRKSLLGDSNQSEDPPLQSSKVSDESQVEAKDEGPREWVSFWKPNVTINLLDDFSRYPKDTAPPNIAPFLNVEPITGNYYPTIFFNEFWLLRDKLIPLNETVTELPLNLEVGPISMTKWQLFLQIDQSFQIHRSYGSMLEGEADELKRVFLEGNPYLLVITMVVSLLHSVFDFLAFKNDIQFWNKNKSMEGLSAKSVVVSFISQLIVFLYLLDNDTSWMILASSGVGCCIEFWKIGKAMHIEIDRSGKIPRLRFRDRESYAKNKTKEYDDIAMKYLSYVLFFLVACSSVYSLKYERHRSWYSWILSSLTSCVYMFGFIMMCPQLFINYKLKSVAHLPWRQMTYKFLNTIIDDLFAFVIKMPMLHRLSVFRDDVIFLIYLYQRWVYPVDRKRVNEFGFGGEDEQKASSSSDGAEQEADDKKTN